MSQTRVFISPNFRGEDAGDGGIRRVVEAQRRWLPQYGIEVVTDPGAADVVALHAGNWVPEIAPETPTVAHCHGLYWDGYSWPKWALAMNKDVIRTMRQSDVITAPSEWVAQALRRGMWVEAISLHHGIEPDDWTEVAAPREDRYVLWNKTRVDPICTPEPVNRLAKLAPDVKFVSTYADSKNNVEVTGTVPFEEAKEYVRKAYVYLATSRETFGIGTLEAMAAAVPILGWNWGGQAEFVGHKAHGYLATPGDYDDLLRGLRYCLEHRDRLGAAARDFVLANYTNEQRVKPYADIYNQLYERERSRPKVSVIITNYNLGKYLSNAVESVASRTDMIGSVECIVVDDASTEPLPEYVTQLAEAQPDRVKIVRNKENLYLAEALNAGIAASRGRYIVPLDADNMLAPYALSTLSSQLDEDRSLDIAYGKMAVIPEADPEKRFIATWPPKDADLDQQVGHKNQISSTAMYRRRVWERVGGYRRRCHTAEDADFWSRALSLGFTGRRVTDAITLVYLDRETSMSHVNRDWAWHYWYRFSRDPKTRLFAAGGESIPSHEFPLVSVVIPVGPGHERHVLDALDSLQNQSFTHWEALVVNDTGTELPWLHPWAKQVTHTSGFPQGAASARNAGMREAKGRFVVFLDADDYLHPEALRMMYDKIQVTGGFVYSDWFNMEEGKVVRTPEFECEKMLEKMQFSVTCMYDLWELREKGIEFDTSMDGRGWEDWDFQLQATVQHGLCAHRIPAPLLHYRMKLGNLRERAYNSQADLLSWIRNKWAAWLVGEEKNMARCGGCGGGGYRPPNRNGSDPATTQAAPEEEAVLLEYIGSEVQAKSYLGRGTGNRYRFAGSGEFKRRYVRKADANSLIATGMFKELSIPGKDGKGDINLEPLAALGPPQREVAVA